MSDSPMPTAIFSAATRDEVEAQFTSHRRRGARFIGVVLVDGSVVLADLRTEFTKVSVGPYLFLSYMLSGRIVNVNIPLRIVAGTCPFSTPRVVGPYRSSDPKAPLFFHSLLTLLANNAAEHAEKHELIQESLIRSHSYSEEIARLEPPPADDVLRGVVEFTNSEVLYCDTEYVVGGGGISGVSGGGGPVALGLQWTPSLRRRALRWLRKRPLLVEDLCSANRPVCVKDTSGLSI
jgi:hypothetical protein